MREYKDALAAKGLFLIAGTDEVGRGALAGPVVAAAVILPIDFNNEMIRDSKTLTKTQLKKADALIRKHALAFSIKVVGVQTIDEKNIKNASRIAMKKAVESLKITPEQVLVDFESLDINIPQQGIVKGDAKSISIAAASIIAKVYRDKLMQKLDKEFPIYGWKSNVGYGSAHHRQAILDKGWTNYHRTSFEPIKSLLQAENVVKKS